MKSLPSLPVVALTTAEQCLADQITFDRSDRDFER
jgi:hypothetical protein